MYPPREGHCLKGASILGTIFTLFSVLSSYIFSTGSRFVLDAQENCGRVVRERFWHCFEPIFKHIYVCFRRRIRKKGRASGGDSFERNTVLTIKEHVFGDQGPDTFSEPLWIHSWTSLLRILAAFWRHLGSISGALDLRWTSQKLYFLAPFFGPVPGGPGDTKATQEGSGMRYWDGTLY